MQIPPCFFLQLTGSSLCSPPQVFAPRNWARGYPGKGTFWGQVITGRTGSHCSTSLSPTHTAPPPTTPSTPLLSLPSSTHSQNTPPASISSGGHKVTFRSPGDHSAAALLTLPTLPAVGRLSLFFEKEPGPCRDICVLLCPPPQSTLFCSGVSSLFPKGESGDPQLSNLLLPSAAAREPLERKTCGGLYLTDTLHHEQKGTISQGSSPGWALPRFSGEAAQTPGLGHGSSSASVRSGCSQNSSTDIRLRSMLFSIQGPGVKGKPQRGDNN